VILTRQARPVFPLFQYEKAFIAAQSRLKAWLKSRQIGGTTTATLDMVLHVIRTGQDWHTMSRSQRQAKSLLRKTARHIRAINRYNDAAGEQPIVRESDIGTETIRFLNGGTITAVPCDPDTTVGETTNWLIDEFALFPNSEQTFAIIKPSIMHGLRMSIIFTPRGRDNMAFRLWDGRFSEHRGWSWHRTTLQDAIADGLVVYDAAGTPIDYQTFADAEILEIGEDMFGQEHCCVFSDELLSLLSWKLVIACQSSKLDARKTTTQLRTLGHDLYVGVDIGRRHDMTVITALSRTGDEYSVEYLQELRNTPFDAQEAIIQELLDTNCVAAMRIDEQGIGLPLADHFSMKYPLTAAGTPFTSPMKARIGGLVRSTMEAGQLWIPDDVELARDLVSVQKTISATGAIQLSAPRTHGSHADRFWSMGLALLAGSEASPTGVAMAFSNS
jgi:phage FluMu gp28-like protein